MKRTRSLVYLAAAVLCSGSVFAQGANDCASAQPIVGFGTYAFDNTAANTDGPHDCNGNPVRRDVWFDFTAPLTDGYKVSLCGGTTLDTRLAVYDGLDCVNFPLIECNVNACVSSQSQLSFLGLAGQHYLIRVGSRQVGTSGSGTFDITQEPCLVAPDDGLEENDTCGTAVPMVDGSYPGLFVSKTDPDYYTVQIAEGATIQLDWFFVGASGDIDVFLWDACGGNLLGQSISPDSDEQIIYTNTGTCTIDAVIRTELWGGDTNTDCNTYMFVISGEGAGTPCAGGPGTNYCTSTVNSTGAASTISATGSASIAANDLVISADNLPQQPGIFIAGPSPAQIPFFNGFLCIDPNGLQRFLSVTSPSGGVVAEAVDLASAAAGGLNAMSGSSYFYQRWNRDPMGGGGNANFSDGLDVLYSP
ncbi:MAG: hypothetical protein E2O39_03400 [Planctomycetota bacterium]|nr:MAG: hypothetical protein E2O39_03400 [Planctomycetota bacterium]